MKQIVLAIITNPEGKYFLCSHNDPGPFCGFYSPPGGHMEPGETQEGALVRELREELSAKVVPVRKIAITVGDKPDREFHWWECTLLTDPGDFVIDPKEILRAGFYSRGEMPNLPVYPATESFFRTFIDTPNVNRERER